MIRSRSWRRHQYRKIAQRRVQILGSNYHSRVSEGNSQKHTAHPADCGTASCSICHPEKNIGNSTKVITKKSKRQRLLKDELKQIKQLPIKELQENL